MTQKAIEPMATQPWEDDFTARLRQRFGFEVSDFQTYLGQPFFTAGRISVPDVLLFLRDFEQFDYLVDLTAVDNLKRLQAFEVVYTLYSFTKNQRIRAKVLAADGARVPSVTPVYLGANWLEREVFDMFGIEFDGHPDMRRILLPEEWNGHPLRKDASILGMDNEWVRKNIGIESGQ